MDGKKLVINVGFSHPVIIEPPEGISFEVDMKVRQIKVLGYDKQSVDRLQRTSVNYAHQSLIKAKVFGIRVSTYVVNRVKPAKQYNFEGEKLWQKNHEMRPVYADISCAEKSLRHA